MPVEPAQPATAVLVEKPAVDVDDPDYAITYYKGEPKNFNTASLWFGMAYVLLGWVAVGVMFYVAFFLDDSFDLSLPKLPFYAFVATVPLGVISVLCAVAGFFTAKKRTYSVTPGIIGLLLSVGTAVGTYLLFV